MCAVIFKRRKKERPRIFVGTIAAVPEGSLIQDIGHVLSSSLFASEQDDRRIEQLVSSYLPLPPASSMPDRKSTDLALDVFVTRWNTGGGFHGDIPLFWRPRIDARARLTNLNSQKTVHTFREQSKATWGESVSRWLSLKHQFSFDNKLFGKDEMEILLNRAMIDLLTQVAKFLR